MSERFRWRQIEPAFYVAFQGKGHFFLYTAQKVFMLKEF